MKTATSNTVIQSFIASFVLLFVYTAISKLVDHTNFQSMISFLLKDETLAYLLSYAIPVMELITGILLVFPRTQLAGIVSFNCIMLLFTLYIGYMLLQERSLPCSCGGVISSMTWKQHFAFNMGFLAAGIFTLVWQVKKL